MLLILRRRPFLLAGLLAIVLLILIQRSNVIDQETLAKIPGHDYITKLPDAVNDRLREGFSLPTSQAPLDAPLEDAHKLPNPDAFRPHFDAVAKMPGITMAEAEAGCTWTDADKVNFQYGKGVEWAINKRNDSEVIERRAALHDFMKRGLVPWSTVKDKFKGRGIVTLGGNEEGKTFKRMLITLNELKRVGCQLPVGELMNNLQGARVLMCGYRGSPLGRRIIRG